MSDDYEESPYEEDEPRQATAVEILPPPKKQLTWSQVALYAFGILMACKVGTHAIDRLSGAANAGAPQAMVTDSLPVSHYVEDRRGAAEEPPQTRYARSEPEPPRPRWHMGVTPDDDERCPNGAHRGTWGGCWWTQEEQEAMWRERWDREARRPQSQFKYGHFCSPEDDECWR